MSARHRRHVLTFHGLSGIGKTELSRRLERWLRGELDKEPCEWHKPPPIDRLVRTVRFDFHGSNIDAVGLVLRLRAALAGPQTSFPAFDVGLAAWWANAHPGEQVPDLPIPGGWSLREQIIDTLGEVITGTVEGLGVGPLSVRTGVKILEAVREGRFRNQALQTVPSWHRWSRRRRVPPRNRWLLLSQDCFPGIWNNLITRKCHSWSPLPMLSSISRVGTTPRNGYSTASFI